tara:strand:+ start:58 stop:303 length:246 start_codon:yes stop_codon:yes gene_type:complete
MEKKNKMDYETQLKEKELKALNNLSSIAGSLDDLRAEIQKPTLSAELSEINHSIISVADSLCILNKTMDNIAESLRVIKYN